MRRSHVLAAAAALSLVAVGLSSAPRPVEAAPTSVHFTAVGDYNATANTTAVLNGIAAAAPELNLALGDLAYGSSDEYAWCSFVKARVGEGFPFELIAGNHESNGLNGNINNFSACLPNQLPGVVGTYGREWYVDVPQQSPLIRFIMISPGLTFPEGKWSYAAGDAHYQWTSNAIDGARSAQIPWVVVGMHEPCIAVGEHQCDSGAAITNLLLSKKVDLVLAGHEHHYTRTKQLRLATGCTGLVPGTYDADCVGDTDDNLLKGAGTVVATAGTGGTPLREVNTSDSEMPYLASWSGSNVSPSYGYLDITADAESLNARFVPVSGSFTDAFSISTTSTPPANQPPTAVIAAPTCAALACTFDGSGSTDPDGTISGYAWDFGDGASSTQAQPNHTYASSGTYTVGLTVTDDDGATASTSRTVTVTDGAAQPLAADAFSRSVNGGWGTADVGGAWSMTWSSRAAVSGGVGRILMPNAGSGSMAALSGLSSTSTDMRLSFTFDKDQTSTEYLTLYGRDVPGAGRYQAAFRLRTAGRVQVSLDRVTGSTTTSIAPAIQVSGLTQNAGDVLDVRFQVTGTSPSQLRVKVWKHGTAEPSSWTLTASDSTSSLQAAGGIAIETYLSGGTTNAPMTLSVDDLNVTPVGP
jgi:PKD repeat protein